MIKLTNLITEKFPDMPEIKFWNKEEKLELTPQDIKNIWSFKSAFGKKLKTLIARKQLVRALPSIYMDTKQDGIKDTAEKLQSDSFIDLLNNGNLG